MGLGPRNRAGAGFDADRLGARRQPIVDKTVGGGGNQAGTKKIAAQQAAGWKLVPTLVLS